MDFSLQGLVKIRDRPNPDGTTVNISAWAGNMNVTRAELRELRNFVDTLLSEMQAGPGVGDTVRIHTSPGQRGLIGKTGKVIREFTSGNVIVLVDNEGVVMAPSWVSVL